MELMKAEYIDHLGDDLRVADAARVSFNKESAWEIKKVSTFLEPETYELTLSEKDEKLIKYLANHGHWTPFAHPQITVRETVPIFVARQRFKHMVGFVYNEVSRRYVDDEPEFFKPIWRQRPEKSIKQGSGEAFLDKIQKKITKEVDKHNAKALKLYNKLLKDNVAPEQARSVLPQSMYTSYYVTGSLAAWARAYKQRRDTHTAQIEIVELAGYWDEIMGSLFPVSWKYLAPTYEE